MDRVFGSHKVPVLLGAGLTGAALAVLAVRGTLAPPMLLLWFCVFGFVCAYTPVMIAHGKSLFPPHLVGRGMTVLNVGTIGGVFLAQTLSGVVIELFPAPDGAYPLAAYQAVFGIQAALHARGLRGLSRVRAIPCAHDKRLTDSGMRACRS